MSFRIWSGTGSPAPAPDVAWCGDMTEIVTDEGKLCLATVIDLHSRRLLGYAMDAHHDTELEHGCGDPRR
ncbi:DDE-type integrase/transposase/recombinase [Streptomyces murinus]|uniref:DDE-type integrase/transposase/recombinase n=1 Tax=Streptomyces murinus TaxID=33900 RepID=UPI003810C817